MIKPSRSETGTKASAGTGWGFGCACLAGSSSEPLSRRSSARRCDTHVADNLSNETYREYPQVMLFEQYLNKTWLAFQRRLARKRFFCGQMRIDRMPTVGKEKDPSRGSGD